MTSGAFKGISRNGAAGRELFEHPGVPSFVGKYGHVGNKEMWYTRRMTSKSNGLTKQFSVTVGDRGRLVLPAALRTQLHLERNDRVLLTLERDGSVRLSASRGKIDSAVGMYAHIARGRDPVAELLRERRKEVRDERKR